MYFRLILPKYILASSLDKKHLALLACITGH